jgi:hypothetical protein
LGQNTSVSTALILSTRLYTLYGNAGESKANTKIKKQYPHSTQINKLRYGSDTLSFIYVKIDDNTVDTC